MKDAVWHKCFLFVLFGLKCEERTINLRQTFLPVVCESLLCNRQGETALMDGFLSVPTQAGQSDQILRNQVKFSIVSQQLNLSKRAYKTYFDAGVSLE